jgi:hypothetical protein
MNFIFQSETHIGDCFLHSHYMRKVVENNPNITFDFHLLEKHKKQVSEYIDDIPQITIKSYDSAPLNSYRGWIGQFGIPPIPFDLNFLRYHSYNNLSRKMGIESPFKSIEDLLFDNPKLEGKHIQSSYDILLINSEPLSNQTSYNAIDYENFVFKCIKANRSVITTKKIDNVPCTMDYGMSILDIGALSTKCKVIVGINTGPLITCLNIWNKNKTIVSIDSNCYLNSFKNVKIAHSINSITL